MANFGRAIVNVGSFKSATKSTLDKNGNQSIYLTPLAGKFPKNRNVIAGTVAKDLKLEIGKNYVVQITEGKANEYGRQFNFLNLGEHLMTVEGFKMEEMLGEVKEISVEDVVREDVTSDVVNTAVN